MTLENAIAALIGALIGLLGAVSTYIRAKAKQIERTDCRVRRIADAAGVDITPANGTEMPPELREELEERKRNE